MLISHVLYLTKKKIIFFKSGLRMLLFKPLLRDSGPFSSETHYLTSQTVSR